jgi:hypothetical protein
MAEVLLIGMGPTDLSALNSLAARFNVVGVVRDQAPGFLSVDPVVDRAQKLGIPVFSAVSLTAVTEGGRAIAARLRGGVFLQSYTAS